MPARICWTLNACFYAGASIKRQNSKFERSNGELAVASRPLTVQ